MTIEPVTYRHQPQPLDIAAWVRDNRSRMRWTQADLARRLQVATVTVTSWESGARVPRYEMAVRMSLLFNAPLPGAQPTTQPKGE